VRIAVSIQLSEVVYVYFESGLHLLFNIIGNSLLPDLFFLKERDLEKDGIGRQDTGREGEVCKVR